MNNNRHFRFLPPAFLRPPISARSSSSKIEVTSLPAIHANCRSVDAFNWTDNSTKCTGVGDPNPQPCVPLLVKKPLT